VTPAAGRGGGGQTWMGGLVRAKFRTSSDGRECMGVLFMCVQIPRKLIYANTSIQRSEPPPQP
jgi:hypothetical protein